MPRKTRRSYTDAEKEVALATFVAVGSFSEAARQLKMPVNTLYNLYQRYKNKSVAVDNRNNSIVIQNTNKTQDKQIDIQVDNKQDIETAKENKEKENITLENLRKRKKEEFIEKAWDNVSLASDLLNKRLRRANAEEAEVDALIKKFVEGSADADTAQKLAAKLAGLHKMTNVEVINAFGVCYDKHALASGGATSNVEVLLLEQIVDRLSGDKY
jgi:transposase-like protein